MENFRRRVYYSLTSGLLLVNVGVTTRQRRVYYSSTMRIVLPFFGFLAVPDYAHPVFAGHAERIGRRWSHAARAASGAAEGSRQPRRPRRNAFRVLTAPAPSPPPRPRVLPSRTCRRRGCDGSFQYLEGMAARGRSRRFAMLFVVSLLCRRVRYGPADELCAVAPLAQLAFSQPPVLPFPLSLSINRAISLCLVYLI